VPLELPKLPKVADLVDVVVALDVRITELEQYVARNDGRITSLEGRTAASTAALKAQFDRDRWLGKLRRR